MAATPWLRGAIERLALAGVRPEDTDEERLRKSTLTLATALIVVLSVIWVATYLALGLWLSALIPLVYQVAWVLGMCSSSLEGTSRRSVRVSSR